MVLQYITSILPVRALHCATSRSTLEVKDTIMKQKLIALSFAAALALATGVAFAPQAMAAPPNNTNSTNSTNNKTTTNTRPAPLTCNVLDSSICSAANNKSDTKNTAIFALLKWVLRIMVGVVGIAAVGAFVFAGILYGSASGNAGQVEKAKTLMFNTVIGLVAFGLMFIAINWLIPGGVLG